MSPVLSRSRAEICPGKASSCPLVEPNGLQSCGLKASALGPFGRPRGPELALPGHILALDLDRTGLILCHFLAYGHSLRSFRKLLRSGGENQVDLHTFVFCVGMLRFGPKYALHGHILGAQNPGPGFKG